jgi:hypothetical protein
VLPVSTTRMNFDTMLVTGADKDIPRSQRRGAIVILGMVAVARRQVVTERIDTLLNVGLGPLGKVSKTALYLNDRLY